MEVVLKIYRFDPFQDKKAGYDEHRITAEKGETVLSLLQKVSENIDPTLAFRFACGKVKCGECSVNANGIPCLACEKQVEPEILVEPLAGMPVIKDLVVDRHKVIDDLSRRSPWLSKDKKPFDTLGDVPSSDLQTYIKLSGCYQCLICQSVCPVVSDEPKGFVGPLGLLWLSQRVKDPRIQFEWNEHLDAMVGECIECGACWRACPAGEIMLEKSFELLRSKNEMSSE